MNEDLWSSVLVDTSQYDNIGDALAQNRMVSSLVQKITNPDEISFLAEQIVNKVNTSAEEIQRTWTTPKNKKTNPAKKKPDSDFHFQPKNRNNQNGEPKRASSAFANRNKMTPNTWNHA